MAARKPNLLYEQNTRKVHPKVRMVANGSAQVNAVRAGTAGAVCVTGKLADDVPVELPAVSRSKFNEPRGRLRRKVKQVTAAVFVRMNPRKETPKKETAKEAAKKLPDCLGKDPPRRGNLITAQVSLDEIERLARHPDVAYVELGEPLKTPTATVENRRPAKPATREFPLEKDKGKKKGHHYGEGVLIGVIDAQGFDFAHVDFLDGDGNTRFFSIWDQGVGSPGTELEFAL